MIEASIVEAAPNTLVFFHQFIKHAAGMAVREEDDAGGNAEKKSASLKQSYARPGSGENQDGTAGEEDYRRY